MSLVEIQCRNGIMFVCGDLMISGFPNALIA